MYKSNPKAGLITLIVALIRSKGHFSEFKNSSRFKYELLIFKSAESIFILESVLLDNEQWEYRLIVELITAPLLSLKKAVVSEPPPPKIIFYCCLRQEWM